MNRSVTGMESTPEYQLEKTSLQWVLSKTTLQNFLVLEVKLVQLRQELTELDKSCGNIIGELQRAELQLQDMD